jgi:hypothetical protein
MNSAVYSSAETSFQVAHIMYAGSVYQIPEDKRKNESTHSFKILTCVGPSFFYFKGEDTAKNARGALGAKIRELKRAAFCHGHEIIDPASVVSFSQAFALKNPQGDLTHAFTVTLATLDGAENKVWLKYKSEENAQKGRKALFAAMHAAHPSIERAESLVVEHQQ